MAYFFFSGSSRGLPAGVSITLAAIGVEAIPEAPTITVGTVLKLPALEAVSEIAMPTIEFGIDLEPIPVDIFATIDIPPSISIGVGPWWYWDMIREGD